MSDNRYADLETLDLDYPVWDRCFTVAPLVLVGTIDAEGSPDLAPKHMAFPLGWDNYFGFVCTPNHATFRNIKRTRSFTVTYPRHTDVVTTSLTASPRCQDTKPIVEMLDTFPATEVDGVFVCNGYLFLECELERIVEGFGRNALIVGRIVAAHIDPAALRSSDRDDAEVLLEVPQLAYLHPRRFAVIDATQAFPFPAGMRR
ncbi:MAG: flavin reductase [Actinomycetia bacterium]|nr:flavin reductase [Actinomycetes bacterium]